MTPGGFTPAEHFGIRAYPNPRISIRSLSANAFVAIFLHSRLGWLRRVRYRAPRWS